MNEKERAVRRLTLADNQINGAYYLFAKKLGIKENTLTILYALDDGEPHSQKQLGEEWLIPKTTVNTIIRELEGQGCIRLISSRPGREKIIALTETGREYAAALMKSIYQAEELALEKTLEQFSPEFIEAYECFAAHLCGEIKKILPEEKNEP